jgi:isopenicillin-N epimerase
MVSDGTRLREEFLLDPSVTFLNHGSFGATPRAVFERYQEWQLELERQPVLFSPAGRTRCSRKPVPRSVFT